MERHVGIERRRGVPLNIIQIRKLTRRNRNEIIDTLKGLLEYSRQQMHSENRKKENKKTIDKLRFNILKKKQLLQQQAQKIEAILFEEFFSKIQNSQILKIQFNISKLMQLDRNKQNTTIIEQCQQQPNVSIFQKINFLKINLEHNLEEPSQLTQVFMLKKKLKFLQKLQQSLKYCIEVQEFEIDIGFQFIQKLVMRIQQQFTKQEALLTQIKSILSQIIFFRQFPKLKKLKIYVKSSNQFGVIFNKFDFDWIHLQLKQLELRISDDNELKNWKINNLIPWNNSLEHFNLFIGKRNNYEDDDNSSNIMNELKKLDKLKSLMIEITNGNKIEYLCSGIISRFLQNLELKFGLRVDLTNEFNFKIDFENLESIKLIFEGYNNIKKEQIEKISNTFSNLKILKNIDIYIGNNYNPSNDYSLISRSLNSQSLRNVTFFVGECNRVNQKFLISMNSIIHSNMYLKKLYIMIERGSDLEYSFIDQNFLQNPSQITELKYYKQLKQLNLFVNFASQNSSTNQNNSKDSMIQKSLHKKQYELAYLKILPCFPSLKYLNLEFVLLKKQVIHITYSDNSLQILLSGKPNQNALSNLENFISYITQRQGHKEGMIIKITFKMLMLASNYLNILNKLKAFTKAVQITFDIGNGQGYCLNILQWFLEKSKTLKYEELKVKVNQYLSCRRIWIKKIDQNFLKIKISRKNIILNPSEILNKLTTYLVEEKNKIISLKIYQIQIRENINFNVNVLVNFFKAIMEIQYLLQIHLEINTSTRQNNLQNQINQGIFMIKNIITDRNSFIKTNLTFFNQNMDRFSFYTDEIVKRTRIHNKTNPVINDRRMELFDILEGNMAIHQQLY